MKIKAPLSELICGYAVSGCLMAGISLYGLGRDVALSIAASLLFVPASGVLGILLADLIIVDRRTLLLIPQVLLATLFGVMCSGLVLFIFKFGLLTILIGWVGSVAVACLVWQAATW